jgi:hypothetical protein
MQALARRVNIQYVYYWGRVKYSRFFGYSQGSKEPNPREYQGSTIFRWASASKGWTLIFLDYACEPWKLIISPWRLSKRFKA